MQIHNQTVHKNLVDEWCDRPSNFTVSPVTETLDYLIPNLGPIPCIVDHWNSFNKVVELGVGNRHFPYLPTFTKGSS